LFTTSLADQPDLAQRIQASNTAAAAWAFGNRDRFSPFDETDTYRPARLKAFVEFAIMTAAYAVNWPRKRDAQYEPTVDLIAAAAERDDFTDWLFRRPEIIVEFAEVLGSLRELGRESPQLLNKLRSASIVEALNHVERVPHRALEVALVNEWAELGLLEASPLETLIEGTILGTKLRSPWIGREAAYAVTHVIMFIFRFGLFRSRPGVSLPTLDLGPLLTDLLVINAAEGDWDLLGEILLCWKCLGLPSTRLTSAAWACFLSAQKADGSFLPNRASGDEGEQHRAADDVELRYHTTFVAVLAGTAWLS
jgi:hypothetical protein